MATARAAERLLQSTELFKLLADPSRLRLLLLLQHQELTVAELAQITDLKQPRVSTQLAKLKEAGLVVDRRAGVQAFYRLAEHEQASAMRVLLKQFFDNAADIRLKQDQNRLKSVLQARAGLSWADQVAGDMERHYSPGRTWDTLARSLIQLLSLGDVLDIASGDGALAELLALRARSVRCVDQSHAVVSAARKRLQRYANVEVDALDMHALPAAFSASFDLALLLQALPYSDQPAQLMQEVARVLRPGGTILGSALQSHAFEAEVQAFGHKNLGFEPAAIERLLSEAGFTHVSVLRAARERKSPHFEVLVFTAKRPC